MASTWTDQFLRFAGLHNERRTGEGISKRKRAGADFDGKFRRQPGQPEFTVEACMALPGDGDGENRRTGDTLKLGAETHGKVTQGTVVHTDGDTGKVTYVGGKRYGRWTGRWDAGFSMRISARSPETRQMKSGVPGRDTAGDLLCGRLRRAASCRRPRRRS